MDNYIVSARRYRPATFENVVGQKSLTTTLKNAIQGNKLAHAYLFCGPRGVGKTSCARIFAKTINCMNLTLAGEACNECESCQSFNEQRSLNIHELDAASNNSVEDIRSLIDQVRIPPQIGKYKVYIIDEVHMLSQAAFNAFLKTLEEPPHHAIFILATTEKHKILATILSRCQVYDFSRISVTNVVEHLQYVASSQNVTAEVDALNIIAQKADGGMRDALSIFDQVVSYTGGNITYQSVIENLNVLDYEYYFRITDAILKGEIRNCMLLLNKILEKGFDGQHIITGLASHFRDLLVCKDESTLVLFEVGASIRDRYKETAGQCPEWLLYKAIEIANNCDLHYRESRNKRLLLELTLIQLCQLSETDPAVTGDKKKNLIKPITDVPQSTDSSVSESSSVPTKQVEVKISEIRNNKRIPKSTSFKDLIEQNSTVSEPIQAYEVNKTKTDHPFTQEDLTHYWNLYAEKLEKQAHLKNTMFNCLPTLKDNFKFEVLVHNPVQKDELAGCCIDLLHTLRTQLKNSHIQMLISIDETNEKKLAYTSTEKYEHLNKINPLLDKLKDEFDLTID